MHNKSVSADLVKLPAQTTPTAIFWQPFIQFNQLHDRKQRSGRHRALKDSDVAERVAEVWRGREHHRRYGVGQTRTQAEAR